MLEHLNLLLGPEHAISKAYVQAFADKGFSEVCLKHVTLDRLEARLRTLDKKRDGTLIREWEGTWASDVLESPGYEAFQSPYQDAAAVVNEAQKKARKMLADD
jgi:hypothetical protein